MKTDSVHPSVRRGNTAFLCAAILLSISTPVTARVGAPPLSLQRKVLPLNTVPQLVLPRTDVPGELAADAKTKTGIPNPPRFAVAHQVAVSPATHGTWEQLPDGRLWRLRIKSAGATDLNLGFTTFWLPEGATFHVTSERESYFQGPFTARDNKPHGQLWTPLVPGDGAVIELFVPEGREEAKLSLTQVSSGYRGFFQRLKGGVGPKAEGACNIDVVCPQAAGWSNEVRSVGLYTINGTFTCSGTLVANTAGDFRNYFLTANHCGLNAANAPTVVVYWNYQSPTCGTHGPGSLAQNQSGAIFRAARHDVDFALIELDDIPEASFGVYYSGWDRSGAAPPGGVGIHHPDADVKAISFSSKPLATINSCISTGGTNTHWQVTWSDGVTEAGSSGSGIWDPATHQLVGSLSGGGSSCFNPTSPDCYGKFSVAWASGGSSADRLSDWLDPQNTGVTSIPGADPMLASIIVAAGVSLVSESCSPTNGAIDPGETVAASFTLRNLGGVSTTNLVVTLLPNAGVISPGAAQNYGVLGGGGPGVARTFTFAAAGACGGSIAPTFQLQDGTRNLGTVTFGLRLGLATPASIFAQNFDGLAAPALPAGWTSSSTGGGNPWATSTGQSDTPFNAVFAADPGMVTDTRLTSPPIPITSTNAQLTFRHTYDTESGYDGGVLEISMNGGPFNDILSAGGAFVTNGYDATINEYYQNPLAGRNAWSGSSGGFVPTTVNLPPGAAGGNIQLLWRLGSDNSSGAIGWYVDTISITEPAYSCCVPLVRPLIVDTRNLGPNGMAFSYDSLVGQTYFVEAATNLSTAFWTTLETNAGDGSRKSWTNSTTDSVKRYFRVRAQ